MIRSASVILIGEDPEARGVFDTPTEIRRTVKCTEKSVRQYRISQADGSGIMPDVRLVFERESTYRGEKRAVYRGQEYTVEDFVPFEKVSGGELLLRRTDGNAAELPEEG